MLHAAWNAGMLHWVGPSHHQGESILCFSAWIRPLCELLKQHLLQSFIFHESVQTVTVIPRVHSHIWTHLTWIRCTQTTKYYVSGCKAFHNNYGGTFWFKSIYICYRRRQQSTTDCRLWISCRRNICPFLSSCLIERSQIHIYRVLSCFGASGLGHLSMPFCFMRQSWKNHFLG